MKIFQIKINEYDNKYIAYVCEEEDNIINKRKED